MHSMTLVFKNLSRRKGRSVLNSIGLILAIAVIVATFTISKAMQTQIGEEVEKYGPNIVVKPQTQSVTIPYGDVTVGRSTMQENLIDRISNIPNAKNIRVASPKLFGQARVGEETVLLVGLLPEREQYLKVWWEIEGRVPRDGENEALLGFDVMKTLGLSLGSTVTINDTPFTVVASLGETGSNDDYLVFVQLATAQRVLEQLGEVSLVDIGALCSDCPVEEIARQIMEIVPGVKAIPVKQAVETRMKAVEQATSFSLMLGSVVLVTGCAAVMNTMINAVHQRKREIGVFMSLGADDIFVCKIFLYEALILGIAGGLLGSAMGVIFSVLLGPHMLSTAIRIEDIPVFIVPLSIAGAAVACLVSSLYPTWRATKIDPVSALKAI
jgi:putative ABC transport system permease protein